MPEDKEMTASELKDRAAQLLDITVSEWKSDPMSVQCFDLRIVNEAKVIVAKLRDMNELYK